MTTGQTADEQSGELRCRCGYLLQGLTEKRCPECGQPFPGKPRRKKYLLSGFLIGLGIVAAPTLVWLAFVLFMSSDQSGAEAAFALMYAGVGLAIAVVTGLIGMLIGSIIMMVATDDERRLQRDQAMKQ